VEAPSATRVTLNLAGRDIKLEDLIYLGRNGIARNDVVAETFEAVIGAVYTDSSRNMDAVLGVLHSCGFVKNVLQAKLDELESQTPSAATTSPAATTPSVASLKRQPEPRDNPSVESDALRGAQTGDEMLFTPTPVSRKPATVRRKNRRVVQRHITSRPAPATSAAQPKSAVQPESRFETATAPQDSTQQLGQLRIAVIQAASRVEPNLASQQPLQSLEQLKVSIEPESNHCNSANSSDAPSPIPDDTATVISKTEETVDHVQLPIEGLAQPEDGVSLESASTLNSGTLAVLHLEERNGGIQFVEEASSPSTGHQTHLIPKKLAKLPKFSTSSCPYYFSPRPYVPPFQAQLLRALRLRTHFPTFFAQTMRGNYPYDSRVVWRRDCVLDDVETIWPYSSDTAGLYPTIEQGAVATNAKAEDAPVATKATSTEAEDAPMADETRSAETEDAPMADETRSAEAESVLGKLSLSDLKLRYREMGVTIRHCLLNVTNSGFGPLQTAVGATVSSQTGELNFEKLLMASEAKDHIVAALSKTSAGGLTWGQSSAYRRRHVEAKLSRPEWRDDIARWFNSPPDQELREVLAARMVAYAIARWPYLYPLEEKPTLLAHFGLAKTLLDESFEAQGKHAPQTPGNDTGYDFEPGTHTVLSLSACRKTIVRYPHLDLRSSTEPSRITWVLGSDTSCLERIMGPLDDLDVHGYLVFRAVEQFLRSDIRSRYTPDPKPDDTNPDKSNFDTFNYKPSSFTTKFDSPKSDSPEFNEPRSAIHRFTSNEVDDIFVSTLTTDFLSHDNPKPITPKSDEPSPKPASLQSDSTVASAPIEKKKKKNKLGSLQRRKIQKNKRRAQAAALGFEQSQIPPPSATTTLQDGSSKVFPRLETRGEKRGTNE
jgi:hypothetical protein